MACKIILYEDITPKESLNIRLDLLNNYEIKVSLTIILGQVGGSRLGMDVKNLILTEVVHIFSFWCI